MNCTQARDAMLVAELAELHAGQAVTPLVGHLAECPACRARAASIATQTVHVGSLMKQPRRITAGSRSARGFMVVASLPVAAALIVAITHTRRAAPVVNPPAVSSLPVVRHVSVDVARGQQTTVLKTADSTITVIWLTSGEGQ